MTQFRAIPISWGISTDPYHKFLMWVSFRATFNGWGRCDALQVTFTLREIEAALGIKKTTASRYVSRAFTEGMLSPTNSYSREVGKGEVYNLGGEMLMTVKSPGQERDNGGTSAEQAVAENIGTCAAPADNGGTSVGQAWDAYRNTPVTPDTPTKKKPSKSVKSVDGMAPVPEEFIPYLDEILSRWPRKNVEGNRITRIPPVHIWDKIQKNRGLDEPKAVVNAALHYLDVDNGKYPFGMDNFFGQKKHYVKYLLED